MAELCRVFECPSPLPSPSEVFGMGHRLKMGWVDTPSVDAEMVDFEVFRNRPLMQDEVIPMSRTRPIGCEDRSIPFLVYSTLPDPTFGFGINDVVNITYGRFGPRMAANEARTVSGPKTSIAPQRRDDGGVIATAAHALTRRIQREILSRNNVQIVVVTANEPSGLTLRHACLGGVVRRYRGLVSTAALAVTKRDRGIVIGHDVPLGLSAMPRAVTAAARSSRASILPRFAVGMGV